MRVWSQFLKAILVNAPLLALLFAYRWFAVNLYVSYSLPVLGEFPKGFLFDLFFFLVVMFVWAVASQWKWSRAFESHTPRARRSRSSPSFAPRTTTTTRRRKSR